MKKIHYLTPIIVAVAIIIGMIIGLRIAKQVPTVQGLWEPKSNSTIEEVLQLIDRNYVDTVPMKALVRNTLSYMVQQLDPFSIYIPPKQLNEVNEQLGGAFQGIGVEYAPTLDTPIIIRCTPGGPAEKIGLKAGDKLLYADTNSLIGENKNISDFIKGPMGSRVTIKVLRETKHLTFQVPRSVVPIQSSPIAYMLRKGVGYIKLDKFSITSHEELHRHILLLKQRGMEHLILDLRDNGGGLLESALDIVGEFIEEGQLIAYTQNDRGGKRKEYKNRRKGIFKKGEVIVLINRASASASEIVAGALQDWDRATIIGENSFGKGLVQEQYPLANRGALRLTVAKYFTPSGRCIQKQFSKQQHRQPSFLGNSTRFSVDTFTTSKGRKVYSSGGIRPDLFVSYHSPINIAKGDTTLFLKIITHKQVRTLEMKYFSNNVSAWRKAFAHPRDFLRQSTISERLIQTMIENAGIRQPIPPSLKKSLCNKLTLDFAKLLWKEKDYLPILLETDPNIRTSLAHWHITQ